jgi:hypothetical protein
VEELVVAMKEDGDGCDARTTREPKNHVDGSAYEKKGRGSRRGRRQLESDREAAAKLSYIQKE